jgi:DNA-binding transcriptional MerR regulator
VTNVTDEVRSTVDVARLTGASYRQLDYWCSNGLVPGQAEWTGQGTRRQFSYRQVRHVRALFALTGAGVVGESLRDASARLADPALDWFRPLTLTYVEHVTLSLDLPALR